MPHLKTSLLALSFAASLSVLAATAQAETSTGFVAVDLATGKVLAAQNADRPYIPASVLKMPTAVAVLEELGADHRFTTRIAHTGTFENGVVDGDLILIGGADPMLDSPALRDMVKALLARGVTTVTGRLLYDDSAVPHRHAIEERQPADASYNPGLAGLSLDFNRFKVLWNGGSPTGAEVPLDPLPVSLTVPPEQNEVWVPVREPGRFTARMFHWMVAEQGVMLPLPEPGRAPAEASELVRNDSLPLAEILRRALFHSNNMATDTLLIAAAQKALGHPVTLEEAGEWLAARTMAADAAQAWDGLEMPNGSGLTDAARITPAQCASMARRAGQDQTSLALLPPLHLEPFAVSDGRAGAQSPLRAKTGTIFYARGLGGTLRTKSGRDVAFCILTDDHVQRALYDAVPFDKRKEETVRLPAREWVRAAREIEKATVLSWRESL